MTQVDEEVAGLIRSLLDAWNRGDEEAFAGHFTPAATYLTSEGDCRLGRLAIGELLKDPSSVPRVHLSGQVAVRDHGNVRTAIFRWAADPEIGSQATGVVSCVVVKQEGGWLIDVLQSTDILR
jgi:uncharacterized protein (TIGR02246 family)